MFWLGGGEKKKVVDPAVFSSGLPKCTYTIFFYKIFFYFFILFSGDIIVNLYKFYFSSSHFSSQLNK